MKLSEIKGERALDVLAEIMEPAGEIIADETFKDLVQSKNKNVLAIVKHLLKNQKKPILHIMAILEDEEPETYEPSVLSLPLKLLEILNDKELMSLFISQDQKRD